MSELSRRHASWCFVVCALCAISVPAPSARAADGDPPTYDELARLSAELDKTARVFETVAKVVGPSVVYIQSRRSATFADRTFTMTESGSGVIVQPPGTDRPYVLTNHHVIEKTSPDQIAIQTSDRRALHATRVLSDSRSDVALIALEEKDLATARLGDSDRLQVGHWVLAIGSPFELAGSVTHGIVSAKGRRALELPSTDRNKPVINQDFIQTDASINPGNSGGPLVNLRGEVVGVNTAIASSSGGNEGIGFAIPVNLVRRVMEQLLQKGSVTRGYLGVYMDPPLSAQTAAKLGLTRVRGALISDVYDGTPAHQAGMQPHDVVLKINGRPVEDEGDLMNVVSMTPVGNEMPLVVWRDRRELPLKVKVGDRNDFEQLLDARAVERTPPAPVAEPLVRFGIAAREFTAADRTRLNLRDQAGILVTAVAPHASAAQFVDRFDVIDQIERQPVASVADVARVLNSANSADGLLVRVVRRDHHGKLTRQLVIAAPIGQP
jgi:serine protease Do